jgi:hypothetical protein
VEFIISSELWANIIGGILAAVIIASFTKYRDFRKPRTMKELIAIMGVAIKIRNNGEGHHFNDENIWVQQAIEIEQKAILKAKELSPTAGALIEWLDRIPPWDTSNRVQKYVSILDNYFKNSRIDGAEFVN